MSEALNIAIQKEEKGTVQLWTADAISIRDELSRLRTENSQMRRVGEAAIETAEAVKNFRRVFLSGANPDDKDAAQFRQTSAVEQLIFVTSSGTVAEKSHKPSAVAPEQLKKIVSFLRDQADRCLKLERIGEAKGYTESADYLEACLKECNDGGTAH